MRHPSSILPVLVVTLAIAVPPASAQSESETEPSQVRQQLLDTRTTLQLWIETERQISKERENWVTAREILKQQIALMEQEIASLRESISESESSITEYEQKHNDLSQENDRLKASAEDLTTLVTRLEGRTRHVLKRLPDQASEREAVRVLRKQIPEDPNNTEITLSRRFQNVVGILNDINKFNNEITLYSEVQKLEGGNSAQVTSVYVGLGQSYFVSVNGQVAGVGTATADQWQWSRQDAAAVDIERVIAILRNEDVATFVQLPMVLQ